LSAVARTAKAEAIPIIVQDNGDGFRFDLALLERGSAAGDLSARRYLVVGMTRGWFGLRHIPDGIRLLLSTAEDLANLVKDETATAQSDKKTRSGLFSRLGAQLWLLDATRHPAS
jgi:hypothetical protein